MDEVERVLEKEIEPKAHLMSDEWKAFVAVGQNFAAHETVQHARREYVRGPVNANSVEGFNLCQSAWKIGSASLSMQLAFTMKR
jgi:hypothetical protein